MIARNHNDQSESWVVVLLHGLALAAAAAASLLHLSLPAGTLGAVVGTAAAVLTAGFVARSRVRLGVVWLAAGGAAVMGLVLGHWIVDGTTAPHLLGPGTAMGLADAVRFGLLGTALALALRTTTGRWRPFAVVELAVVALALASVVAAHRDGAINHPRALSDWAWTSGRDPVDIFLYCGVATAVALAVALLRERRGRGARVILHLFAAVGLAALVLLLVNHVKLIQPPRGEGLGSSSKKDDDKRQSGNQGGSDGAAGGSSGGRSKNQMDQLDFRNDYNSSSQESPVAVVLLHDDYSPPLGYYYFRQTAFSQYNGARLVATTRDDMDRDILADFPSGATDVPDPPDDGPERVRIRSSVALLADHIHPFGLETPVRFEPSESPDPARFVRAYEVNSAALALRYEDLLGRHAFTARWSDELRAAYTQGPSDARYKQLADRIIQEKLRPEFHRDPFAQAIAISAWLSEHGIYSRRSQHAGKDDPTGDFLFGDLTGYCVHFSHAAAYLLRARGLPARIAAGYVADEGRKGQGSTILLRQKDAHAWAELHLDGFGWIIVDVAPQQTLDPPDTPADRDLQQLLGEMARGQKGRPPQLPKEVRGPSARQIATALLALIAAAVALGYFIKLWRLFAPLVAGRRATYRVAYRASLDRLAEAGWAREPGETRERFAARVGDAAPSFAAATREHVGAAYGGQRLVDAAEMRRLARRARAEAWRRAKWWRVTLGIVNPFSWWLAK